MAIKRYTIQRVKRYTINASKNAKRKLKTYRRKQRKIVMRGGAGGHMLILKRRIENANNMKIHCIIVRETKSGEKDTLYLFWPSNVTKDEVTNVLTKFVKNDEKINEVITKLNLQSSTTSPTTSQTPTYLPQYIQIVSKPGTSMFSSYDTKIQIKNIDSPETLDYVNEALIDNFDKNRDQIINVDNLKKEYRLLESSIDLSRDKMKDNLIFGFRFYSKNN